MAGIGLAEVSAVINSDLGTPLNHIIWLQDYKTFAEDSYVFQKKEILHELYANYPLVMNDSWIRQEVFDYVIEKGLHMGECLCAIEGVNGAPEEWEALSNMYELVRNGNILAYCQASPIIMECINANHIATDAYITATDQSEVYNELVSIAALDTNQFPTAVSILDTDQGIAALTTNYDILSGCIESAVVMNYVLNVYNALAYAIANDATALSMFLHSENALECLKGSIYGTVITESPCMADAVAGQTIVDGAAWYNGMCIVTGYKMNAASNSASVRCNSYYEGGSGYVDGTVYAFARSYIQYTDFINGETINDPRSNAAGGIYAGGGTYGTITQPYSTQTVTGKYIVAANVKTMADAYTYSVSNYQTIHAGSGYAIYTDESKSVTATPTAGTVSYIPLPLRA